MPFKKRIASLLGTGFKKLPLKAGFLNGLNLGLVSALEIVATRDASDANNLPQIFSLITSLSEIHPPHGV